MLRRANRAYLLHDEEVDGDGQDLRRDVSDSQLEDKLLILQRQTLGDCEKERLSVWTPWYKGLRLTLHSSQGEEKVGNLSNAKSHGLSTRIVLYFPFRRVELTAGLAKGDDMVLYGEC